MARLKPVAFDAVLIALAVVTVVACAFVRASFYLPATLLVVYGLAAAFADFERGRESVRKMALIAALSALAVASRVIFAPLPFFKPVAGVIVLSGIALGRRSGFLVGSIAMLASNVLFGQGPWTPWQMLAFGLDGWAFGLMADRGLISRRSWTLKARLAVSIGAAAFILLITGPILDTSSVLLFTTGSLTVQGVVAVYLAGVGPNAILAGATLLTVMLLSGPFLKMMERLRDKYGIGAVDPVQSGRI